MRTIQKEAAEVLGKCVSESWGKKDQELHSLIITPIIHSLSPRITDPAHVFVVVLCVSLIGCAAANPSCTSLLVQGQPRLRVNAGGVRVSDWLRGRRPPLAPTASGTVRAAMVDQPALHQQLLRQHRAHGEQPLYHP